LWRIDASEPDVDEVSCPPVMEREPVSVVHEPSVPPKASVIVVAVPLVDPTLASAVLLSACQPSPSPPSAAIPAVAYGSRLSVG
jgi:hypothetical protein